VPLENWPFTAARSLLGHRNHPRSPLSRRLRERLPPFARASPAVCASAAWSFTIGASSTSARAILRAERQIPRVNTPTRPTPTVPDPNQALGLR